MDLPDQIYRFYVPQETNETVFQNKLIENQSWRQGSGLGNVVEEWIEKTKCAKAKID